MTSPQKVTERYASNLLRHGNNNEFRLLELKSVPLLADGLCVGIYYECTLGTQSDVTKRTAAGMTPSQALHRSLEKFGVTFR